MSDVDSGRIWLDDDVIRYRSATYGNWDLPLRNLRIVGENTNEDGPFADDWFLCFVSGPDEWAAASFYAEPKFDIVRQLGQRLGSKLIPDLAGFATFASRILWPDELAGQPLFEFIPQHRRWPLSLLGPKSVSQRFTPHVLDFLNRP